LEGEGEGRLCLALFHLLHSTLRTYYLDLEGGVRLGVENTECLTKIEERLEIYSGSYKNRVTLCIIHWILLEIDSIQIIDAHRSHNAQKYDRLVAKAMKRRKFGLGALIRSQQKHGSENYLNYSSH
jgi:hypothetical protein